jgi:hypothetical protein
MEANAFNQRLGEGTSLWSDWSTRREGIEFVWIGSTIAQFPKIRFGHGQLDRQVCGFFVSTFHRLKILLKEKLNSSFAPLPTET